MTDPDSCLVNLVRVLVRSVLAGRLLITVVDNAVSDGVLPFSGETMINSLHNELWFAPVM